jgi:trehalose 6-phosphate synthase
VDDPVVLVQDYHFALAPAMIRKRLPKATILTFWHIPWPNAERFGICPWRDEILEGMLGSSIMGFHTQQHCNNFLDAVDTYLEARLDREQKAVIKGGRTTLVRPYPISIAWPDQWTEMQPPVQECRRQILAKLGLSSDVRLGIGVDRLDYTKGIEERFRAVDQMLESFPEFRERFSFVQIGAPSRSRIPEYQRLNESVVQVAEEINRKWSTASWSPIILLAKHQEAKDIYTFYRAADVCYVSSLHDGMNLVAKEFISSRDDEQGTLVLSQFAGAAKELTEALIVNPYDFTQASSALAAALRMPPSEQTKRMRSMRQLVAQRNVYRWAGRMLTDASRLRSQERLGESLSSIHALTGRWKP